VWRHKVGWRAKIFPDVILFLLSDCLWHEVTQESDCRAVAELPLLYKWWVVICVSELIPASWLCRFACITTRIRAVNVYVYEWFSKLRSQILKRSMLFLRHFLWLYFARRSYPCVPSRDMLKILFPDSRCVFFFCVHVCAYIVLVCMFSLVYSRFTVGRSWRIAPNAVAMLRVRFDSC
jgi:hypothetical protein